MNAKLQSGFNLVRWLVVGLIFVLPAAAGFLVVFGTTIERTGLDWLFQLRGAQKPPAEVVVVSISRKTGEALGFDDNKPHHWPRTIHARLIQELVQRNVQAIVFNLDFSRARPGDQDAIFAGSVANADRVVLLEWLETKFEPRLAALGISVEERRAPMGALAAAAKALGPWPLAKEEAAYTFWAFKASAGGAPTVAAVALQVRALAVYHEWLSVLKEARAPAVENLPTYAIKVRSPQDVTLLMQKQRQMFQRDEFLKDRVEDALKRTDSKNRQLLAALANLYAGPDCYYLNHYGPPGTIRTIPYESLVTGTNKEDLSDHIVFVGSSDLYQPNQPGFYTAFTGKSGVDISGVEIMATAYANLLSQRTIKSSEAPATALSVLLFGVLVVIIVYCLPATVAVPLAFILTGLYGWVVLWRFDEADVWLPLSTPVLVQLPLALFIGLMGQYLIQNRTHKRLAPYSPDEVVKAAPAAGGEKRKVTMIMADLRGFTRLSEELSEEKVGKILEIFHKEMNPIIKKRYQGEIVDFFGDAIFAYFCTSCRGTGSIVRSTFGRLSAHLSPGQRDWKAKSYEDDVGRAVACAVAMQLAMPSVNERIQKEGLSQRPLEMGIGVNTGLVVMGNIGSAERLKYGPVGRSVNRTDRVQKVTSGKQILISERTWQEVSSIVKVDAPQEVRAKGIDGVLIVYPVLGIGAPYNLFLPDVADGSAPQVRSYVEMERVHSHDEPEERHAAIK